MWLPVGMVGAGSTCPQPLSPPSGEEVAACGRHHTYHKVLTSWAPSGPWEMGESHGLHEGERGMTVAARSTGKAAKRTEVREGGWNPGQSPPFLHTALGKLLPLSQPWHPHLYVGST